MYRETRWWYSFPERETYRREAGATPRPGMSEGKIEPCKGEILPSHDISPLQGSVSLCFLTPGRDFAPTLGYPTLAGSEDLGHLTDQSETLQKHIDNGVQNHYVQLMGFLSFHTMTTPTTPLHDG